MLTWDNIFDFSADKPLQDVLKGLNQVSSTVESMEQAVVASNERIAESFIDVKNAAKQLSDTTKNLAPAMEGADKALVETAQHSEDLVKQFQALKTQENENAKVIALLREQIQKLSDAKKKLKDDNISEAGSYNDLQKKLADAVNAYKKLGEGTSQAVKDEHLAKIRGLSTEFKNSKDALNAAQKGAAAAAGSYNELAGRVAEAKKRLKEMEGGIEGNSKEFQELKKFASEGTKQLKDWDNAVGDNQRKVGDYAGELGKISPAFGNMVAAIDGGTKASLAFIATPLGATLAVIAAAVAALTAYFNGSIEGQDDLNKVVQVGIAIFETLMDVLEDIGKALFEVITGSGKAFDALTQGAKDAGSAIKDAFNDPIGTIKAMGQAIADFAVRSIKGLAIVADGFKQLFSGNFKQGFKELVDGVVQYATGIENATDKIVAAWKPVVDEMKARIALAQQIAALENQLRKDRIADILDDAKTELEVTKLLVEAKDKLRFSDSERFNKLRQANALLEDQLKGDLKLARDEIALQQLVIKQTGETYEERQKLVELQAKEIELQTQFFQARKKRQAEEIALIREIEKDMIDSRKRVVDAENALNTVRINDVIAQNKKILDEENSGLDERLAAIAENDAATQALYEQDRDAQLDAIREAGLARVQLDADTLDAIYNQNDKSIEDRIQQERDAKMKLLEQDVAYANETLKVQEDFTNKSNALLESSKKLAADNVFKVMARDAAILNSEIDETANNALTALNDAFAGGDIDSVQEFEDKKLAIQKKAQEESIKAQIDYLQQRSQLLQAGSRERADIEDQISKLELKLSEDGAKQRLQYEQDLQEQLANLKQVAFESAVTVMNNLFEAEEQDRQARLEKLEEDYNAQLTLAGDNEAAKIEIENDFNAKKKKIEQEQAAAARKQAIFNKAMAVVEIAINTAKGIAWALGSYPPPASIILAAIVGAAGALQIAAVASKPIPQFAKGTEDAPGGWAMINELGPERIVTPSGEERTIYTDGPTLAYIPQHSKVYTASKTRQLEEQEAFDANIGNIANGKNTIINVSNEQHTKELEEAIRFEMAALRHTIATKKEASINFTKNGVYVMIKDAASTTKFLNDYFD